MYHIYHPATTFPPPRDLLSLSNSSFTFRVASTYTTCTSFCVSFFVLYFFWLREVRSWARIYFFRVPMRLVSKLSPSPSCSIDDYKRHTCVVRVAHTRFRPHHNTHWLSFHINVCRSVRPFCVDVFSVFSTAAINTVAGFWRLSLSALAAGARHFSMHSFIVAALALSTLAFQDVFQLVILRLRKIALLRRIALLLHAKHQQKQCNKASAGIGYYREHPFKSWK